MKSHFRNVISHVLALTLIFGGLPSETTAQETKGLTERNGEVIRMPETEEDLLKMYRDDLAYFKKNYEKDLKDMHRSTLDAHFAKMALDIRASLIFLSFYIDTNSYRLASIATAQRASGTRYIEALANDEVNSSSLADFNLSRFYGNVAERIPDQIAAAVSEAKEVVKIYEEGCSEENQAWPKLYFNPEIYLAPLSLGYSADNISYNFGVHVRSYGMKSIDSDLTTAGGSGTHVGVGINFDITGNPRYDTAITAGLAAGAYQGALAAGFTGLAATGVGALIVAGVAVLWAGIKGAEALFKRWDQVKIRNKIFNTLDDINQVMKEGTPDKAYGDRIVSETCKDNLEPPEREAILKEMKKMLKQMDANQAKAIAEYDKGIEMNNLITDLFVEKLRGEAQEWSFLTASLAFEMRVNELFDAAARWRSKAKSLQNELIMAAQQVQRSKDREDWRTELRAKFDLEQAVRGLDYAVSSQNLDNPSFTSSAYIRRLDALRVFGEGVLEK